MSNFIEYPRFPEDMSFFATGGPEYSTTVIQLNSGFEQRNVNWTQSRAKYQISSALRTITNEYPISETIAFFRAVKGRAYGFRFKDFQDYKTSKTNGLLDNGFYIANKKTYQLNKKYIAGLNYDIKNIKKPVDGTINIYVNNILKTENVNYTIDYSTGIVTFNPNSSILINSISIGSNPIIVTATNHNLSDGDTIFLTDLFTSPLNNTYQVITLIDATSFSINTQNSTLIGYGSVKVFNQDNDQLNWEGEYDIPCRFDMDNIVYSNDGGLINLNNISIVEIRI